MSAPSEEVTLTFGLDESEDHQAIATRLSTTLGIPESDLPSYVIRSRSIDARRGRVRIHLLVELGAEPVTELALPHPRQVSLPSRVLIVGSGPAGMFCAYELARAGIASTLIDRGKTVQPRRKDLAIIHRTGHVDEDSNYCFGEGGAGTYSDGKLYTRSHKRGDVRDVIEILTLHGAPRRILSDARPHIGSNRLPKVISSLRQRLENVGVEFRFGSRLSRLVTKQSRIRGAVVSDGSEIEADALVLATGHSARDVYSLLEAAGIRLEAKSFALGVRIEHPQPLINEIQYGRVAGHPKLPAASYRLAQTVEGRGVFSFCMCPGGWIVPASTDNNALVVNGMSLARRDSPFANSGLVVSIEPGDLVQAGLEGPLAGIRLQQRLEQAGYRAGGGAQRAPATRVSDFVAARGSTTVPASSYRPGLNPCNLDEVLELAELGLSRRLRQALRGFDRRLRGYLTDEAVLVGIESRTSSPVRVPRDPSTLESPDLANLYPCGEGAGFAGGIVSAAIDGIRCARAIAAKRVSAVGTFRR